MSSKNYLKNILTLLILLALISFQGLQGWAQNKQELKKQPLPEISAKVSDKISLTTVRIACNQEEKLGTGAIVAIEPKGRLLILTACHVVSSNFEETDPNIPLEFYKDIKVKLASELQPVAAIVVPKFVDRANDLAIILTAAPILIDDVISYTHSNKIKTGAIVAAAGFPGTEELTLTAGRYVRPDNKYIVFDAKIDKGCSGGPLIDKKGRMIGLSTFIQKGEEENESYATNIDLIASIVDKWLNYIKLNKRWQLKEDRPIYKNPIFISGGLLAATGTAIIASGILAKEDEGKFPLPPGRP